MGLVVTSGLVGTHLSDGHCPFGAYDRHLSLGGFKIGIKRRNGMEPVQLWRQPLRVPRRHRFASARYKRLGFRRKPIRVAELRRRGQERPPLRSGPTPNPRRYGRMDRSRLCATSPHRQGYRRSRLHGKRPYALIVGLCPIGREADIDESLAEQCVELRRTLFRDRQVCRTGECLRSMREVEIGIADRPRPAQRIPELGGRFTRGLVTREAGRIRCWGWRQERQAVWQSRWVEVSVRSTGRQIRNTGSRAPRLICGLRSQLGRYRYASHSAPTTRHERRHNISRSSLISRRRGRDFAPLTSPA